MIALSLLIIHILHHAQSPTILKCILVNRLKFDVQNFGEKKFRGGETKQNLGEKKFLVRKILSPKNCRLKRLWV